MGEVVDLASRREDSTPVGQDDEGEALAPGAVVPFPAQVQRRRSQTRTCFICEHASVGSITYCALHREEILFESVAAEHCDDFTPDDDATLEWGD